MYSTIARKKCKCAGCTANPEKAKYPTLSCEGFFFAHMPKDVAERAGTKRAVQVKNRNKRVSTASKMHKLQRAIDGTDEQELWFLARKYEMTDRCSEDGCTKRTNKFSDKYYKWSVAHIVPKALVPSVATHFFNWIELCQDHHNEYDSTFDKAKNLKCFDEIKRRFKLIEHLIPPEELRKVNPYLL